MFVLLPVSHKEVECLFYHPSLFSPPCFAGIEGLSRVQVYGVAPKTFYRGGTASQHLLGVGHIAPSRSLGAIVLRMVRKNSADNVHYPEAQDMLESFCILEDVDILHYNIICIVFNYVHMYK